MQHKVDDHPRLKQELAQVNEHIQSQSMRADEERVHAQYILSTSFASSVQVLMHYY
jgi:hypothetical protein